MSKQLQDTWDNLVEDLDLYDEDAVCRLCGCETGAHPNCSVGQLEALIAELKEEE